MAKRWYAYVVSTYNKEVEERNTYYTDGYTAQEAVDNVRSFLDDNYEKVIDVYKEVGKNRWE